VAISGALDVRFSDGREPDKAPFSLTTEHEAVLRRFSVAVKDLAEAVRDAGGLQAALNISFQQGEQLQVRTTQPTRPEREAMLYRLRPLILRKEETSFELVRGIVGQSSGYPELRKYLKRLASIYDGADLRSVVQITHGESVVNSDEAFQQWLNGFEYHRYADSAAAIAGDGALLDIDVLRPIFLMMLSEKLKAIGMLAAIVDAMLARA